MTARLDEQVELVADRTLEPMPEFEERLGNVWQGGWVIDGLLATGKDGYEDEAKRLLDRAIETGSTMADERDASDEPDWVGDFRTITQAQFGPAVLRFYEKTNEETYRCEAHEMFDWLQSLDRTQDGGHTPMKETTTLWVDSMYNTVPFLAKYGDTFDDRGAIDDAVRQLLVHAKHLQDDRTGLFRHIWREQPNSYPQSHFWLRGNGWAANGLLDTLEHVPDAHPRRMEIEELFRELCLRVIAARDESGLWNNVVDDPESPWEISGALMFSYAFERGADRNLLPVRYADAARRAFEAAREYVDEDGRVQQVSISPGGPDPTLGWARWGQAFFLLAAAQYL